MLQIFVFKSGTKYEIGKYEIPHRRADPNKCPTGGTKHLTNARQISVVGVGAGIGNAWINNLGLVWLF